MADESKINFQIKLKVTVPPVTYHKIKIYEDKREKVIYMMRVGNKWVPFSHHNTGLRSYHPPSGETDPPITD